MLATACVTSGRGQAPAPHALRYPTAVALDPAGDWLYVVSTNFDNAYGGGTVLPVGLADLEALRAATTVPARGGPVRLSLKDAKLATAEPAEIGSFAGQLAFLARDGVATAGYVPIRDGDVVDWFTVARPAGVPVLACTTATSLSRCDTAHRLSLSWKDPTGTYGTLVGSEPFALAVGEGVVPGTPLIYVGSVADGTFSVVTVADDGKPSVATAIPLSPGLHTVVEGPLLESGRVVYVSNRTVDGIHAVQVEKVADGTLHVATIPSAVLPQVTSTGDYFRGMAASKGRRLVYAATRSPAGLAVFDVVDDGTLSLRGLVPLHGLPAEVATAPGAVAGDEMVYVTDFHDDGVYAVDPLAMAVVARIEVGDGPYGIAVQGDPAAGPLRAYVALFEEDGLSVVDLDPASPTYHTEIARLK